MKRGMPSGGHHSPTAFIFLVNSHSKKSLFLLTMGLAGRIPSSSPWGSLGAYERLRSVGLRLHRTQPAPQPRQCAREAAPLARADGPGNSGGAAGAHGVRAEPSRLPALSRAPARRGGGTGLGAEAGRRAARRDADRAGQALRPRSGAVDSRERGAGRRRAARAAAAVTNLPNTVQRVSK